MFWMLKKQLEKSHMWAYYWESGEDKQHTSLWFTVVREVNHYNLYSANW